MDKKRPLIKQPLTAEDLRGFEEFVEGQSSDTFMPRPQGVAGNQKATSFEHFTFLTTDSDRLSRIKELLNEKLPFAMKFNQGAALLKEQEEEVASIKKKIFESSDGPGSAYRRSLGEVFDSFFSPPE